MLANQGAAAAGIVVVAQLLSAVHAAAPLEGQAVLQPVAVAAQLPSHTPWLAICNADQELVSPNATAHELRLEITALGLPPASLDATSAQLKHHLATARRLALSLQHNAALNDSTALCAALTDRGEVR